MKRTILIFGGLAIAVFLLFQMSKFSLLLSGQSSEIFLAIMGISFISVGYILSRLFSNNKLQNASTGLPDAYQLELTGLSKREYEILGLMAKGHSNMEIGNSLFISESTVKGHVSNVLMKLNARRRTHAIQIAREHNLL